LFFGGIEKVLRDAIPEERARAAIARNMFQRAGRTRRVTRSKLVRASLRRC